MSANWLYIQSTAENTSPNLKSCMKPHKGVNNGQHGTTLSFQHPRAILDKITVSTVVKDTSCVYHHDRNVSNDLCTENETKCQRVSLCEGRDIQPGGGVRLERKKDSRPRTIASHGNTYTNMYSNSEQMLLSCAHVGSAKCFDHKGLHQLQCTKCVCPIYILT